MCNWGKLKALTTRQRKLLLQALFLLPLTHLSLKTMGYARTVRTIEKQISIPEKTEPDSSRENLNNAVEAARIVSIAAHYGLYRATCLRRSLVLIILLRRQGIESKIYFGVQMHDQGIEAHAWVEIQEIVINDHPDIRQQYIPLDDQFPSTQVGL